MPRKNNNITRKAKSRGWPKPAQNSTAQPPVDLHSVAVPAAVLDEQKLQQLYSSMLKCQMLQRRLHEISPVAQVVAGREAVLAGALAHSRRDDYVVAAQNRALVAMLHGDPLISVLDPITSETAGAEHSHTAPPSVEQLVLMEAVERAKRLPDSGSAVLVFCGDDPETIASQRESLALAAKDKAPLVCFVEVRLAALADEAQARGKRGKSSQPQFPVIAVDGVDVVAVFRVAQEAIRRARTGHGPSLIKCVMPEDGHDPLQFIEQYLRRKNAWSDAWQTKIAQEFAAQLDFALSPASGRL